MSGAPGASPLFRPQALETAGGDDYDHALRMLAPRSRATGWFLVAVAFAALVWSGFTEVPVKVAGNGILVTPDGVVDVVPAHPGRLQELLVRPGELGQVGMVMAVMAVVAVVAVTTMAVRLAGEIARLRIDIRLGERTNAALLDRVLRLPSRFFATSTVGELAARIAAMTGVPTGLR